PVTSAQTNARHTAIESSAYIRWERPVLPVQAHGFVFRRWRFGGAAVTVRLSKPLCFIRIGSRREGSPVRVVGRRSLHAVRSGFGVDRAPRQRGTDTTA